ncbi:DinB family protein [Nonomuraea sp. LPB2021202275-12-8]|uniref:DinB family protein n=1 Tax=Nonomuraea sp. LPB2021202275-12-8 TaxID=3120159 RepID=UPI003FA612D6
MARARTFPETALHRNVDDEWSFIQTLRHLNFACAAWVGRMILGNSSPWHPTDLPWADGPRRHGLTHRRATRLRGDADRTRLAPAGELPLQGMSPHRPQRGMGAPALCRTRPDLTGKGAAPA